MPESGPLCCVLNDHVMGKNERKIAMVTIARHESKARKVPAPTPSHHAPRKRGTWWALSLGLDLTSPGPLELSLPRDRNLTSEQFETP